MFQWPCKMKVLKDLCVHIYEALLRLLVGIYLHYLFDDVLLINIDYDVLISRKDIKTY